MEKAIALLEVQAMVTAIVGLDAMVKAADVKLIHVEKRLGGRLVTVVVEGSVSASLIVLSLIRHQRATIGKENGALGKPELFLILCTQVVSGYHDRCLLC